MSKCGGVPPTLPDPILPRERRIERGWGPTWPLPQTASTHGEGTGCEVLPLPPPLSSLEGIAEGRTCPSRALGGACVPAAKQRIASFSPHPNPSPRWGEGLLRFLPFGSGGLATPLAEGAASAITSNRRGGLLRLPPIGAENIRDSICRGAAAALLGVYVLLFVQGCAPVVVQPAPLPAGQAQPTEYRIQVGDQMDVKLFYNPELNEEVTVRPDGRISLQLAQEIPAAGLTPAELTETLRTRYARELYRPEIAVIMRSFAGQRVYVDGEVNQPSFLPLSTNMTVLQSIAMAGGLKQSARAQEVAVIRRGPEGQPLVFQVDLTRARDGSDAAQDVALLPSDVVYVPKSAIANVNLWVDQYLRQNIPIGLGLYYGVNQ